MIQFYQKNLKNELGKKRMDNTIVLCLLAAICFSWPLISKQAVGVDPAWTALIVAQSAALVALVEIIRKTSPVPTMTNSAWLSAAGVTLGVGMLLYAKAYAPPYQVSQTGPLIVGLRLLF